MPPTTILQILQQAKQKIDPLDAELLIAHILNKPREWVLAHPEAKVLKVCKVHKVIKSINQRANGEPLAYLTGHKEFFGLDFEVNKDVLIPRPDTEIMVECVIERLRTYDIGPMTTLIDVGTGSGCIPISILKNLPHNFSPYQGEREGVCIKTIAVDISKQTLIIAKRNAKKHKVKIKFLHGNLLSPILKSYIIRHTSSLIITANLPYLTAKQHKSSPSIQHEPKLALVAKNNGLALYEKLLKQIARLLTLRTLKTLWTFIEIDPSQTKSIKLLINNLLPGAKTQVIKDLSGLDRIVKIWYN